MKEFITSNSLNIYSLVVLAILFIQAKKSLKSYDKYYVKLWLAVIAIIFVIQTAEILSWLYLYLPQRFFLYLSSVCNALIFLLVCAMTSSAAIFIEYGVNFSKKAAAYLFKIFLPITCVNALLALLSIPFGLYFNYTNGVYGYGPLYPVYLILIFSPFVIELFRLVFMHKDAKQIRNVLIMGIVFPLIFITLRLFTTINLYMLFPSFTLSILVMNFLIINNNLSIDYLTGLKNKRGVEEYFSKMPPQLSDYFSVIYMDINGFKKINDRYGHKEGDWALRIFSKMILKCIRISDLGAREGGDEFLIAMHSQSENDYQTVLDRLQGEINEFNASGTKPYKLSVSCGVTVIKPFENIDKENIINTTDFKMYKEKSSIKKYF